MADFAVRIAAEADLDALMVLEESAFASDRLSRRAMRYAIRSRAQMVLIAEMKARFAGVAIIGFRAGSKTARISSIAVDGRLAGQGIGRRLLAASEDRLRRQGFEMVRLEVRADNAGAIALYERSGYHLFGRYEEYYEDSTDALRFEKTI